MPLSPFTFAWQIMAVTLAAYLAQTSVCQEEDERRRLSCLLKCQVYTEVMNACHSYSFLHHSICHLIVRCQTEMSQSIYNQYFGIKLNLHQLHLTKNEMNDVFLEGKSLVRSGFDKRAALQLRQTIQCCSN